MLLLARIYLHVLSILAKPPPSGNPCIPSPCGANSQCKVVGNQPACSCLPNFIGRPPNCRPECTINAECPGNLACQNEKCRDPCPGSCGSFTTCVVIKHAPVCQCDSGYTGDPFSVCTPIPTSKNYFCSIFVTELIIKTDCVCSQFQPQKNLAHLAIPHHAERTLNVGNRTAPELALVCLNTLVILTQAVDPSASLIPIAIREELVLITNVSIRALELVVQTLSAKSLIMHLLVFVLKALREIQSELVCVLNQVRYFFWFAKDAVLEKQAKYILLFNLTDLLIPHPWYYFLLRINFIYRH